jgi:hypothetical protein
MIRAPGPTDSRMNPVISHDLSITKKFWNELYCHDVTKLANRLS